MNKVDLVMRKISGFRKDDTGDRQLNGLEEEIGTVFVAEADEPYLAHIGNGVIVHTKTGNSFMGVYRGLDRIDRLVLKPVVESERTSEDKQVEWKHKLVDRPAYVSYGCEESVSPISLETIEEMTRKIIRC